MTTDANEYLDTYLEEIESLLAGMDENLLTLKYEPANAGAIEALYRIAHTLKTSAGLMGFPATKAFARALETVLSPLKTGEKTADEKTLDLLAGGFEYIRTISADVEASGVEDEKTLDEKTRAVDEFVGRSR